MQNRNNLDINKLEIKKDRGDINKRIKTTNSLPKKDGHSTFIKDRGDLLTKNDKDTINKSNEVSEDSKNVKAEDLNKQSNRFNRSDSKNKDEGGLNVSKNYLVTKIVKPNGDFKSKNFEKFNSFDTVPKNNNQNEIKSKKSKNPPNLDIITDKGCVKSVKDEVIPKKARQNEATIKSFARNVHVVQRNIVGSENMISDDKKEKVVDTRPKPQKRPVISTVVAKNDATKVFKAVTFGVEKTKLNMPLQIKIPVLMKHNPDEDITKQNTNNQNILQDTEKNKKPKNLPNKNDQFNYGKATSLKVIKNGISSRNRKEPNLKKNNPKAPQINDNVFKVSYNTEGDKNTRYGKESKALQTDGDVKNLSNKRNGDVDLRNKKDLKFLRMEDCLKNSRDMKDVFIDSCNTEGVTNLYTRNGKDSKALQPDGDIKNLSNKRNGDVDLRNKKDLKFLRMEDCLQNSRDMKVPKVSQNDGDVKKIKKDPKISTVTKVSKRSQRNVRNLARNRREPKVPQSNDTESKTSASGKSRASKKKSERQKKHLSPMTLFTDNGSPITEVAKWAPNCVDNHTKRYYEAWIDTTLAAVARDTRTNQDIVRAIRRAVERAPPSPELIHENYLDERYTGRIKINHRH